MTQACETSCLTPTLTTKGLLMFTTRRRPITWFNILCKFPLGPRCSLNTRSVMVFLRENTQKCPAHVTNAVERRSNAMRNLTLVRLLAQAALALPSGVCSVECLRREDQAKGKTGPIAPKSRINANLLLVTSRNSRTESIVSKTSSSQKAA